MNLKENKEVYMRALEGRKERDNDVIILLTQIYKNDLKKNDTKGTQIKMDQVFVV